MIREIDFDDRSGAHLDDETYQVVDNAIRSALENIPFEAGFQVSVSFVDHEEIQSLNRDYRQKDNVTDVLSFPMQEQDGRGVELLGDIVICIDRAKEQAIEYGHSFLRELSYLTVHSVLHLLGYDHENDEDKTEMRNAEKTIMTRLQIFKE